VIPDRCREHSSAVREDDGRVMQRQGGVEGKIPQEQCAIIGANVRALRQRNGWSQVRLGQLMGWQSASTVCAAEGHRGDRQRGFSAGEVEQLAAIFSVSPEQLTMRCATCGGHPPAGFACLACGKAQVGG
jgi:hypothetical protein